jgi:hypothetical protein
MRHHAEIQRSCCVFCVQCVHPEHGMAAIYNLAGPRGCLSRPQSVVLGTDIPDDPGCTTRTVKDGAGPRWQLQRPLAENFMERNAKTSISTAHDETRVQ